MQITEFILWVIFGLVTSGMLVWASHRLNRDREILGLALVLLGGWYLAFGVMAGHGMEVLLPQVIGGFFFVSCGITGLRYSMLFLSVGWALHAAWDFGSPLFSDVSYMPHWTAPACLGFDLLVSGYVLAKWKYARSSKATAA